MVPHGTLHPSAFPLLIFLMSPIPTRTEAPSPSGTNDTGQVLVSVSQQKTHAKKKKKVNK